MTKNPIRIVVAGASGKMGKEAILALASDKRFEVVGALARKSIELTGGFVTDNPTELIRETTPDVWLDLTDARSVVSNVSKAIEMGVRPVVGATGYDAADLLNWEQECRKQNLGCIVAPNFSLGALLMMRFAAQAARFYASAEIIELHHDGKKDAPSGTAKRTAEVIENAHMNELSDFFVTSTGQASLDAPSRGEDYAGVRLHSVRLPGLLAHQEVLFGGTGEVLTIRHDSLSRQSFMPGVLYACEQIMKLNSFVYGLEHLLF